MAVNALTTLPSATVAFLAPILWLAFVIENRLRGGRSVLLIRLLSRLLKHRVRLAPNWFTYSNRE